MEISGARSRGGRAALAGALVVLAAGGAAAQSNDEIQTGVEFNFSTPGARSLGLGGAFLAAADDATAAYTNPAGLAQLAAPEVSLEGRAWSYTTRYAARGHTPPDELTGIGVDDVRGLAFEEREDEAAALSFLSYTHAGRRWAAALYRHQLADYRASLQSEGPFAGPRGDVSRVFPARSRLALSVAGVGVAAACRLGDRLYLGAGAARYQFSLASRTERFDRADPTGDPVRDALTGGHYGPADFSPGNLANLQTQDGDDSDLALTAGFLWRIDGRWSAGGVWRRAPEFGFRAVFTDGPRGERPGEVDPALGGAGTFRVPDVWGLGIAYRAGDRVLVALDWDRVEYSDLGDDLVNLLRAGQAQLADFVIDDADEFHLGAEYQALGLRYPVAFRLGAWFDPDHKLRYTGDAPNLRARFRPGSDEVHYAAGVGVVLGRAQLDLAVDLSPRVDTLSLSSVARF